MEMIDDIIIDLSVAPRTKVKRSGICPRKVMLYKKIEIEPFIFFSLKMYGLPIMLCYYLSDTSNRHKTYNILSQSQDSICEEASRFLKEV